MRQMLPSVDHKVADHAEDDLTLPHTDRREYVQSQDIGLSQTGAGTLRSQGATFTGLNPSMMGLSPSLMGLNP